MGGQLRLVDLFAGCGGMTAGFVGTGLFTPVGAVELERDAASTYALNFGEEHIYHGDIANWLSGEIPDADVVIGGPPCQGFSNLGHRWNRDPRNALWRRYVDAIARIKPQAFVLENVDRFAKSGQLQGLLRETYRSGRLADYKITWDVVRATNYGSPQARVRTVVIGTRRDLPAIPIPPVSTSRDNWRTVRDAIGNLDPVVPPEATLLPHSEIKLLGGPIAGPFKSFDLHVTRFYTDLSLKRFSFIPPGGNRLNLPEELKAPCWIGHDKGSLDVLGRLHWDKPSVTIRTEFYKPEKGRYLHPEEDRAITPLEAARLQGFADDFVWAGTKYQVARQIGNAVPGQLASVLGSHVALALQGSAG